MLIFEQQTKPGTSYPIYDAQLPGVRAAFGIVTCDSSQWVFRFKGPPDGRGVLDLDTVQLEELGYFVRSCRDNLHRVREKNRVAVYRVGNTFEIVP